jgi:hypothetical protein
MKSLKNTLTFCFLVFTSLICAQTNLYVPGNIQAAYDIGTRNTSGLPGKNYWQNFATYNLQIRFEPANRLVTGTEEIEFTNNSPDTLKVIIFNLFPDIYQKGAIRARKIDSSDVSSGVKVIKLSMDGTTKKFKNLRLYSTLKYIDSVALPPQKSLRFNIDYSYTLNKGSIIRTGEVDNGTWFLAYFFPRIELLDDIGPPSISYNGAQEFHNDFCDFNLAITVPKDYIVWATGDLKNISEVLSPKYCQRLASAEKSENITTIIDSTDLKMGDITTDHPENTFRFEAKNVTDVAAAISNHYLWKSSSLVVDSSAGRRTRVDAVFNQNNKGFFEVIDFARKTVDLMSNNFPKWPFPYSHETIFDGDYPGMEYPMMVNEKIGENRKDNIEVTVHEVFHTMFPFYMGTNETKYAWMDEGWATVANWLLDCMIDSSIIKHPNYFEYIAGDEYDLPIITPSDQENGNTYLYNSYFKPAYGYMYVKDFLGDQLFYKGLHQYIRNWNGKHPTPYDFFNSMNVGSGVNLNWFWKRWFFDNGVPDLAIGKFTSGKKKKTIIVEMKGDKPIPIDLTVLFIDGSIQKIHRSVGVWEKGNKAVDIRIASGKTVKEITLGSNYVPDINNKNNHLVVNK